LEHLGQALDENGPVIVSPHLRQPTCLLTLPPPPPPPPCPPSRSFPFRLLPLLVRLQLRQPNLLTELATCQDVSYASLCACGARASLSASSLPFLPTVFPLPSPPHQSSPLPASSLETHGPCSLSPCPFSPHSHTIRHTHHRQDNQHQRRIAD
jgi:hypothetical protein